MLCWSPDSTQVASACANGKLMVSTLVERLEFNKLEFVLLNISRAIGSCSSKKVALNDLICTQKYQTTRNII